MKIHELKCWPEYFLPIERGKKRFEIRNDDRGFDVGDVLHLRCWSPSLKDYTGAELLVEVLYVWRSDGPIAGWKGEKFAIMSIAKLECVP